MLKECIARWLKNISRKKNLNSVKSMATQLNRCLTTSHLIFYSVAQMAGAGIYTLTGLLIRYQAGPSGCLSYLIGAIASLFTGMCYVEFASIIPRAGSCYLYTYVMLGELIAFIVGWTMISDVIIAVSSASKAFSGTVDLLIDGVIRNWTLTNIGTMSDDYGVLDTTPDILAFGIIFILTIITLIGANLSLTLNNVLSSTQIICLFVISIGCFGYGNISNWTNDGGFFPFGFTGVVKGASIVVFAFNGFDGLAVACEETINPRKSIPIAMIVSIVIITFLYLMATLGLSYLVPRDHLSIISPFVDAFKEVGQEAFVWISVVGTIIATGASKLAYMYVIPRYVYAMANDGLIFKFLAYIDPRTQVPIFALLFGATLCGLMALFINIESLAEFLSMGVLVSYLMIGINLFIFRYLYFDSSTDPKTSTYSSKEFTKIEFRDFVGVNCRRFLNEGDKYSFKAVLLAHICSDVFVACMVDYAIESNTVMAWIFFGVSIFLVLLTFAVLCCYRPFTDEEGFETPLMPIAPTVTILMNTLLILRIPPLTWIRFVIWTFGGMIIYIFYGIGHSNVDDPQLSPIHSEGYITLKDDGKVVAEEKDSTEQLNLVQVPSKD